MASLVQFPIHQIVMEHVISPSKLQLLWS